jgi:hypothetical protein
MMWTRSQASYQEPDLVQDMTPDCIPDLVPDLVPGLVSALALVLAGALVQVLPITKQNRHRHIYIYIHTYMCWIISTFIEIVSTDGSVPWIQMCLWLGEWSREDNYAANELASMDSYELIQAFRPHEPMHLGPSLWAADLSRNTGCRKWHSLHPKSQLRHVSMTNQASWGLVSDALL